MWEGSVYWGSLMRGLGPLVLILVALIVSGCGDTVDTTAATPAPEPIPTTAPTTTAPSAPEERVLAVTFTGNDCINSRLDEFSSSEMVRLTAINESSAEMVAVVLELDDATLENLVAEDVRLFPPTEVWPPPGDHPKELAAYQRVGPVSEEDQLTFFLAGAYGTVCYPIDGSPAVKGAPFTVED